MFKVNNKRHNDAGGVRGRGEGLSLMTFGNSE